MNWVFETYADIYQVATRPRPSGEVTRLEPTDRPRTTRWNLRKR